jgi:hypothetical protein
LLLFRVQGRERREGCQFGQVLDLLRKQGKERACGRSQRCRDLGGRERGQERTHQVKQGGIRAGTIGWKTLTAEQPEVKSTGLPSQLGHQPRFANAGFTGQQHNTPLPTCGGFETVLQRGQLCAASDEDRTDNRLMEWDCHQRTSSLVIARASWFAGLSGAAWADIRCITEP